MGSIIEHSIRTYFITTQLFVRLIHTQLYKCWLLNAQNNSGSDKDTWYLPSILYVRCYSKE